MFITIILLLRYFEYFLRMALPKESTLNRLKMPIQSRNYVFYLAFYNSLSANPTQQIIQQMLKRQTSCFLRKTTTPHVKKDQSVLLVRGVSMQKNNIQPNKPYKSDFLKRVTSQDTLMKTQIRPFFSSKMKNVDNPEEINEAWQRAALAFAYDDTSSQTTSIQNMLPRKNKSPVASRKRAIGMIQFSKKC